MSVYQAPPALVVLDPPLCNELGMVYNKYLGSPSYDPQRILYFSLNIAFDLANSVVEAFNLSLHCPLKYESLVYKGFKEKTIITNILTTCTVLPAESDSDVMFCLQNYQGLIIDRSLVY